MSLEKFQLLHRLTGFIVILFLLFFAVTGILLNHADQLDMEKKYIDFNWLLKLYSIGPSQPPVSYAADADWLTRVDARLYFNDQELPVRIGALLGVVKLEGVIIAATPDALLLLTENGEIIETVTPVSGLPIPVQNLGKSDNDLFIIATATGYFANNTDIGAWREIQADTVAWSTPGQLPEAMLERIMALYRGSGLTLERALQDLHSGRLLGRGKIIIIDIV